MKQFHLVAVQNDRGAKTRFELIVSAISEEEARAYAVDETGDEVWNNPRYSTCQQLGSFGVIFKSVNQV